MILQENPMEVLLIVLALSVEQALLTPMKAVAQW